MTDSGKPRLTLLGLLCAPGLGTGAVFGLDSLTERVFGSGLTTWGFAGSLIGLAAFLSGFVSIAAWPAVLLLTRRAVRAGGVPRSIRVVAGLACLGATYTAAYFMVWFVIVPLRFVR